MARTKIDASLISPLTSPLKVNVGTSQLSIDAAATTGQIGNNYDLGSIPDTGKTSANINLDIATPATVTVNTSASINTAPTNVASFSNAGASIQGTTTNDSAAAGKIGEFISSSTAAHNAALSTQWGDATSISLTAGDWDVSLNALWGVNTATWTSASIGISPNTGNDATGLTLGDNFANDIWASSSSVPGNFTQSLSPFRVSLSSTTTYYFKIKSIYSAGTPQVYGRISARRVR